MLSSVEGRARVHLLICQSQHMLSEPGLGCSGVVSRQWAFSCAEGKSGLPLYLPNLLARWLLLLPLLLSHGLSPLFWVSIWIWLFAHKASICCMRVVHPPETLSACAKGHCGFSFHEPFLEMVEVLQLSIFQVFASMLEVLHLSRMDGIYVDLMRMMRATMREISADWPIDSFLSSFMFINEIWARWARAVSINILWFNLQQAAEGPLGLCNSLPCG